MGRRFLRPNYIAGKKSGLSVDLRKFNYERRLNTQKESLGALVVKPGQKSSSQLLAQPSLSELITLLGNINYKKFK